MRVVYQRVRVLMDATKVVVQALNSDFDWAINYVIADIKLLLSIFAQVEFSFIPRILNSAAHSLAKFCNSSNQDIGRERVPLFLKGW